MADLEIDDIGVPASRATALLGECGQLDVVVDGNRTAEVLRYGLRDRQADQFRECETGAQVTVRLDHTGESESDRTKASEIERALGRRGVNRAPNRRDLSGPVPLQLGVAQSAAGQVADDGSHPARAQVHSGNESRLPGEPERTRRPPRPHDRRIGGHNQTSLDEIVEHGVHRGSRQSGLRADDADGLRVVGVGQRAQTGDLIGRSLRLSGSSYSVHRPQLIMQPALLKTVSESVGRWQPTVAQGNRQRCRIVRSTTVQVVVVSR